MSEMTYPAVYDRARDGPGPFAGALSSQAMLVLFAANAMFLAVLEARHARRRVAAGDGLVATLWNSYRQTGPKRAEPVAATEASLHRLARAVHKLALYMALVYILELRPPMAHSKKIYDPDLYWFLTALLIALSLTDVRESKTTPTLLNREQTEEWKGWMQFMFLMYHYYSASDVYNAIRVMITCYVWMTGFGNFSFFYIKRDFSLVRVLQMMWRLNFLVLVLCFTLGNQYMLYYICPLHTFFFLMVYGVMRAFQSVNHTVYGIRVKLAVVGLLIYVVWDVEWCLFEWIFAPFLSRVPTIGAAAGTLWEWYFRSSLDHWSTYLGMIYALNFPMAMRWLDHAEALPKARQWAAKGTATAVMVALVAWWAVEIFPEPKLSYNTLNAYFGIIPMMGYVFVRNLTPWLRTHYLAPLHDIGKTTLETYLLQHHVWLTSNAKTLVTLVPGWPKVNMLCATVLFLHTAKALYSLTMTLRGMLVPNKTEHAVRNLCAVFGATAAAFGAAAVARAAGGGTAAALAAAFVLAAAAAAAAERSLQQNGQDPLFSAAWRHVPKVGAAVAAAVLLMASAAHGDGSGAGGLDVLAGEAELGHGTVARPACLRAASHGAWETLPSACAAGSGVCDAVQWTWMPSNDKCGLHQFSAAEATALLRGRHLVLAGDSTLRNVYHGLLRLLGTETAAAAHAGTLEKHQDLTQPLPGGDGRASFLWSPFAANITTRLGALDLKNRDVVLTNAGLWDALHIRDVDAYAKTLARVGDSFPRAARVLWATTTHVVDARLNTAEKQQYMTEHTVSEYRWAFADSELAGRVDGILDAWAITAGRDADSPDGVHYLDREYDAIAQALVNALAHAALPDAPAAAGGAVAEAAPEAKAAPKICSMGNPMLGAGLLVMALVCLVTMDPYFGVAAVAMRVFGGPLKWDDAYGPLHRQIGVGPAVPALPVSGGGGGEDEKGGLLAEEEVGGGR